MTPPRDYPIDAPVARPSGDTENEAPLTFASLHDRHEASLPITDAMILEAREQMEAARPCPATFPAE